MGIFSKESKRGRGEGKGKSESESESKGKGKGKKFSLKSLFSFKDIIMLYDDLYFSKLVKNKSAMCRRIDKSLDHVGVDFLGSYDGENITFYYLIEYLPRELYIDFRERLRRECRPGVRLNFMNNIRGHKVEWESPQMRSRLRILRQVGDERTQQGVDVYNLHENIKMLGKQDWIEESLEYLAVADKQRGRALVKSSVSVTISGKRGSDFDVSVKMIEEYAKYMGIVMTRVLYIVPDFIRFFSPFSNKYIRSVADIEPVQVLTDEIVARYNTYTQGKVGTEGLYFGTDIYSGFPVLKKVKAKEYIAENWLITAETGGGKSFLVKVLLLQLLGYNLGFSFNGTIMDIEGFEYMPLANFLSHNSKVQVINMAEGSGKYFDPVEIADYSDMGYIDNDSKDMSLNFSIAIFKVLLGKAYADDVWLDTVINDAVSEVYKSRGITDDKGTWGNSKGATLFDVYSKLLGLRSFRDDMGYRSAVEKAIAITGRYFDPNGTRVGMFKERVKVGDIIDADLVVCSFGMAGKAQQSVDETQLALMQLGAAQLSHQRSIFSKAKGKFNFKLWEEFQRWGNFPDSDKTLGVSITGGRKLGDVNIIITNDVGKLLDDDKFGIFSNITSFLIGAIADERVRNELCDRMSISNMKKDIDLISTAKRDDDDKEYISPFTFAFLCGLDRSKYGVVKMDIPHDLAGSELFKTGIELK